MEVRYNFIVIIYLRVNIGTNMEFPPRKSKSKVFCCVFGCSSKASRNDTVRFYNFPEPKQALVRITNKRGIEEDMGRRAAWIKVLRMGKKVTSSMRVCSLHFTPDDVFHSGQLCRLKKNSIPSCNLPTGSAGMKRDPRKEIQKTARDERRRKWSTLKQPQKIEDPSSTLTANAVTRCNQEGKKVEEEQLHIKNLARASEEMTENNSRVLEETCSDVTVADVQTDTVPHKAIPALAGVTTTQGSHEASNDQSSEEISMKVFRDIGVQVQSGDIFVKFSSFITNDSDLSTLTGITNFTLLNTIETLVKSVKSSSLRSKLDLRDIIIMTFMKLKQNMSYSLLAVLFKCYNRQTCRARILEMLDILHICLKPAVYWPDKDNVARNIPQSFKGFEDVRVVLDCIEVTIQSPNNLCCQIVTYSHYKSHYTLKFMTGVTPGGFISFISKPYGGRASDKAIFEQSDLMTKMAKKDAIMVDKGFMIDDICKLHDVKLIRPAFLRDKKQFSKTQAILNRNIASARVHIERSNQRIKDFRLLSSRMPTGLISKAEEIFTTICAVVNLSAPIFKDDKF